MPIHSTALVIANEALSDSIFRIRLAEESMAREVVPGQFAMLRPHGRTDPLLGRPLAMYDVSMDSEGKAAAVDFVYLVQGNGTRSLATLRHGDRVDVWGPMGNSFPLEPAADLRHVLLIAGGIGQTPFLSVAKELLGKQQYGGRVVATARDRRVSLVWGARTKELLAGVEDFDKVGVETRVATEDGSAGHRGRVTELAREVIDREPRPTAIFSCGPEPMLQAVAELGSDCGIPTWVSLETKMACGYGVCFSCVCPVKEATPVGWDYVRVCLAGPVFPSVEIAWKEMNH
jgi:dihydroorotate dehydrogenase electron transfer subunit